MRVFLSHRTESEGSFARRLSEDLERQGIPTWVAPRDADPGCTWPQAVEAGMHACTHVTVLVTEQALRSRAVRHELRVAELLQLDGRVAIVPALLERVELPPLLRAVPGADLTGSYADGREDLVRSLRLAAAAAAPADRLVVHQVRRGDRIDLLAARYLGEPTHWRLIADENPGLDVTALEPGMVVSIRARGR
ncbi:TIR domain-containing protein [Actinophytocola sp.]|uniref:TIR domain-containing protein n=1 Tax=Actinophytocola sp. TaxID=1872138 RepID=UPI003D6C0631